MCRPKAVEAGQARPAACYSLVWSLNAEDAEAHKQCRGGNVRRGRRNEGFGRPRLENTRNRRRRRLANERRGLALLQHLRRAILPGDRRLVSRATCVRRREAGKCGAQSHHAHQQNHHRDARDCPHRNSILRSLDSEIKRGGPRMQPPRAAPHGAPLGAQSSQPPCTSITIAPSGRVAGSPAALAR